MQASGESPLIRALIQSQSRPSTEKELSWKPSALLMQPDSSLLLTGPSQLFQDCLHTSLNPSTSQPSLSSTNHTCSGASYHTSLTALHHTCQSSRRLSDSEAQIHPHFATNFHHNAAYHGQPTSGHHTSPGFVHHRDLFSPEVKLSCRSSSLSASSPHRSPCLSPCPSPCPSLTTSAAPLACSPDLTHKVNIADMNRLSADLRPQQRGTQLCGIVCVIFLCKNYRQKQI